MRDKTTSKRLNMLFRPRTHVWFIRDTCRSRSWESFLVLALNTENKVKHTKTMYIILLSVLLENQNEKLP